MHFFFIALLYSNYWALLYQYRNRVCIPKPPEIDVSGTSLLTPQGGADKPSLAVVDFAAILKQIHHSVFVVDHRDRILFCNDLCLKLWQSTLEEPQNRPVMADFFTKIWVSGRYPSINGVTNETQFRQLTEGRLEPFRAEKYTDITWRVQGRLYQITRGWCGNLRVFSHVDITDQEAARVAAEAARKQAEVQRNQMCQIFEALPHSAILADHDLRIIQNNHRILEMMDLSREELIEEPNLDEILIDVWRRGSTCSSCRQSRSMSSAGLCYNCAQRCPRAKVPIKCAQPIQLALAVIACFWRNRFR